jgi:hypothetical protein
MHASPALVGLAVALSLLAAPGRDGQRAHAATFTSNFSPLRVHARPGQVVTTTLSLKLTAATGTTHFAAKAEDWFRSEDGSKTFYRAPGTLRRSCAPWVSLDPTETSAEPGDRLAVRATVTVPRDAKPGGYWCAVTINELADPSRRPGTTGVSFVASFSTGLYVFLAPLDERAQITDVRVDATRVTVRVRNTGNTPLRVTGRFEFLAAPDGAPVATVKLSRAVLLPEPVPVAAFSADLPPASALPAGTYLVRAVLDVGLPHFIGVQKSIEIRRDRPAAGKR